MVAVKLLAQNFPLEINAGTSSVPNWTHISGVNSLTISPSKGTVDTRDYDSGAWLEHLVTTRGATMSLDGQRIQDPDDGSRDAGQEEVETYAWLTGADAIAHFRILSPGGSPYEFNASVEVTPFGGGNDDLATWDAELQMTGALVAA